MDMDLGTRISELRREKGMTQEQLAKLVGISAPAVSNGKQEFPIVKDTTPNITNPRLYDTA